LKHPFSPQGFLCYCILIFRHYFQNKSILNMIQIITGTFKYVQYLCATSLYFTLLYSKYVAH
jgi:hypothetical protein